MNLLRVVCLLCQLSLACISNVGESVAYYRRRKLIVNYTMTSERKVMKLIILIWQAFDKWNDKSNAYKVYYPFLKRKKVYKKMKLKGRKSSENHKVQYPKLHHYYIQNIKDGIQIRVYMISTETVTHFSQCISAKVKKILRKSLTQFREKLWKSRLRQNDGFILQKCTAEKLWWFILIAMNGISYFWYERLKLGTFLWTYQKYRRSYCHKSVLLSCTWQFEMYESFLNKTMTVSIEWLYIKWGRDSL